MMINFTSEQTIAMNKARALPFDDFWMPEPNSGCWLWLGGVSKSGYGTGSDGDGGTMPAHRRSWKIRYGSLPPKPLCILHRCDVPSCVNPDHLFVGTKADNNADRHRKGRDNSGKGPHHGNARLIPEQVAMILADPRRQRAIADDYGIAQSHVSRIKRGQHWTAKE